MKLLVSVSNSDEAAAAIAGGADVIDAKDPSAGPLGAVSIEVLRRIEAVSAAARLLTAALGDADDEARVERTARDAASAGAGLVKIGFAGTASVERAASLTRAAIRGASAAGPGRCGVVAVAYADADDMVTIGPDDILEVATTSGAAGVLLDTADKSGPRLRELFTRERLSAWVARAHGAGLLVAVAGRVRIDDLEFVRETGADIAGVRGAACEGGRTGRVTAERVRALASLTRLAPRM
jgi:uncharacterized protein (UPF0264 family)